MQHDLLYDNFLKNNNKIFLLRLLHKTHVSYLMYFQNKNGSFIFYPKRSTQKQKFRAPRTNIFVSYSVEVNLVILYLYKYIIVVFNDNLFK